MSEVHDKALVWLSDVGPSVTSLVGLHAVKARQFVRDLLAENERLTSALSERQGHWRDAVSRAESAESRLRELCGQKPVAWVGLDGEVTPACSSDSYFADSMIGWQALIPRPEMQK